MVGVVKIQIFLLLVPILHNSQLAAPRPHHQLQKKTLIIVVAHFLFLSYSLSLQLQMLQQLGFFSCRVEKKKKQQATSMDRTRQKRQNLSFFLLCFSNSGQISQDSNVDSLRDCWRIWAPSESTSMLQGKPVVRSAAHCYQTALCRRRRLEVEAWLRKSPSFSWHGPDYPLLLLLQSFFCRSNACCHCLYILPVSCLTALLPPYLICSAVCTDRTGVTASRKILQVP